MTPITARQLTAAFATLAAITALSSPSQATVVSSSATSAAQHEEGNTPMGWSVHQPSRVSLPGFGAAPAYAFPARRVFGIDVASYQGKVDWDSHWDQGRRFVFVKATEGMTYKSPTYHEQTSGAAERGFFRGAYHFARPMSSTGAAQAREFVAYSGKATAGAKTLPGVLDIEYNPGKGGVCYSKSQANMRSWIYDFLRMYKKLTQRNAIIYTTADWWKQCTGNTSAFRKTNPLWLANYNFHPGVKPGSWKDHTFWQYSSKPIDQNVFNGSYSELAAFAQH